MTQTTIYRLIPILTLLTAPVCFADKSEDWRERQQWQAVSGTAIHYFDTDVPGRNAINHTFTPTETGVILRNTETVDIFGDLNGRVLYHPETVIDEAAGTLVNTGKQVFSGTVLGQGPVLLLDEFFRVEVNLVTGETAGTMLLIDPLDSRILNNRRSAANCKDPCPRAQPRGANCKGRSARPAGRGGCALMPSVRLGMLIQGHAQAMVCKNQS